MNTSNTSRTKRTQRDYTQAFKLAVVNEVEKGDLTYKQAQKKYGIQGRSTVLMWLRRYGSHDWSPVGMQVMTKKTETPAQKIKRLERELEDEKIKNLMINKMVDIIDTEYGGNLRKKYLELERELYNKKKE